MRRSVEHGALTQRRNKYSWGKTSLETQQRELDELCSEFPEFREPARSVLISVFEELEQAFVDFLPRRRDKGVKPPQFRSSDDFFPLRYAKPDFEIAGNTLRLRHGSGWLEVELPVGDYDPLQDVVIDWEPIRQVWRVQLEHLF